jgi:hypothetical protein
LLCKWHGFTFKLIHKKELVRVEKFEKILSVLDRSLGTRKKRHIAGGILMSISLMFGGFALTVITLNIGKDKIADINNTIPESKNKRIE